MTPGIVPKILAACGEPNPKRYLCMGNDDSLDLAYVLMCNEWTGTCVSPKEPREDPSQKEVYIRGHLGPDPHIKMLLDGYYEQMLTIETIFNQYPGPYRFISIIGTGRDREIWENASIQNAGAKVIVMPEDGHNEGVILQAKRKEFRPVVLEDKYLMLVRGA